MTYHTAVGCDVISDEMVAFVAGCGIETSGVARHPERTAGLHTIGFWDDEHRFFYWRSPSAAGRLMDRPPRPPGADPLVRHSGITLAILDPADRAALLTRTAKLRAEGAVMAFAPNPRPAL